MLRSHQATRGYVRARCLILSGLKSIPTTSVSGTYAAFSAGGGIKLEHPHPPAYAAESSLDSTKHSYFLHVTLFRKIQQKWKIPRREFLFWEFNIHEVCVLIVFARSFEKKKLSALRESAYRV